MDLIAPTGQREDGGRVFGPVVLHRAQREVKGKGSVCDSVLQTTVTEQTNRDINRWNMSYFTTRGGVRGGGGK